jgi:hypothetical protein
LIGKPGEDFVLGQWKRCAMGLRPSPYAGVKGALIARRTILGDRKDQGNPFRWDRVVLNQPGDEHYQARLPWIMQVREDGELATAVCQYIDDMCTCASSEKDVWEASCRIGKVLAHLGLQDAARKRREPSQALEAWSGATDSSLSKRNTGTVGQNPEFDTIDRGVGRIKRRRQRLASFSGRESSDAWSNV